MLLVARTESPKISAPRFNPAIVPSFRDCEPTVARYKDRLSARKSAGKLTLSARIVTSGSGPKPRVPTSSLKATVPPLVTTSGAPVAFGNGPGAPPADNNMASKVTSPSALTVAGPRLELGSSSRTAITPPKVVAPSEVPNTDDNVIDPPADKEDPSCSTMLSPRIEAGPSTPSTFDDKFRSPSVVTLADRLDPLKPTTVKPVDCVARLSNVASRWKKIQIQTRVLTCCHCPPAR